eukprot:15129_1
MDAKEHSEDCTLTAENKVILKIKHSEKAFCIDDLNTIKYFANQLSGRWSCKNVISIPAQYINFNIDEVEMIIHFKKNEQLRYDYPIVRLPHLCYALNYFTEQIKPQHFLNYLLECIPAVKISDINSLQSFCKKNSLLQHSSLLIAFKDYLKHIQEEDMGMNQKILDNWKTAPDSLFFCNDYVAAHLFINNFKFRTDDARSHYISINQSRISLEMSKGVDLVHKLWNYIKQKALCETYPDIISTICALECRPAYECRTYNKTPTTIICEDMAKVLVSIALDVMEISNQDISTLFRNVFTLVRCQTFEKHTPKISHAYLMKVMKKMTESNSRTIDIGELFVSYYDITLISMERSRNLVEE